MEKLGTRRTYIQARQELTAYILWHIWKDRNAWLFNAEKNSGLEVVQRAWYEWLEFREIQARGQKRQRKENCA